MYVQIATYAIPKTSDAEFIQENQEFASMMSRVPGLVAKIWLKAPNEQVYGGVYLWQDREAYESFVTGELWASVVNDESLSNLESIDFEVMEELTRATQPGVQLV